MAIERTPQAIGMSGVVETKAESVDQHGWVHGISKTRRITTVNPSERNAAFRFMKSPTKTCYRATWSVAGCFGGLCVKLSHPCWLSRFCCNRASVVSSTERSILIFACPNCATLRGHARMSRAPFTSTWCVSGRHGCVSTRHKTFSDYLRGVNTVSALTTRSQESFSKASCKMSG